MHTRFAATIALLLIPLLALHLPNGCVSTYGGGHASSLDNGGGNCLHMMIYINVVNKYKFYEEIACFVNVTMDLTLARISENISAVEVKIPCSDWRTLSIRDLPTGGFYEIVFDETLQPFVRFVIPPQQRVLISYSYLAYGWSVLYRNYFRFNMRFFDIRSNIPGLALFVTCIVRVPRSCYVLPGYPYVESGNASIEEVEEGFAVRGLAGDVTLVYEGVWRIPVGVVICFLWATVAILSDRVLRMCSILTTKVRRCLSSAKLPSTLVRGIRWAISRQGASALFTFTLLLAVLLSIIIGPSPRPALVLIADPSNASELSQEVQELGFTCLVFYENASVMEALEEGLVDIALIGKMPKVAEPYWTNYLNAFVKFLRRGGVIAILSEFVETGLGSQVLKVLGNCDRVTVLSRVEDLPALRAYIQERPRIVSLSPRLHRLTTWVAAGLSALSTMFATLAGVFAVEFFIRRAGVWNIFFAYVVAVLIIMVVLVVVHVMARILHTITYYSSLSSVLTVVAPITVALLVVVLYTDSELGQSMGQLLRVIVPLSFILTAMLTAPYGDVLIVNVSSEGASLTVEGALLRACEYAGDIMGMHGLPLSTGIALWIVVFALVALFFLKKEVCETVRDIALGGIIVLLGLAFPRSVGVSFLSTVCTIPLAIIVGIILQLSALGVSYLWRRYRTQ